MTDLAPAPTRRPARSASRVLSAAWFSARGDEIALIIDDGTRGEDGIGPRPIVSCAELGERIDERRAALGRTRRLVQLADVDDLEAMVTLFAALDGGHPLIFSEGGRSATEIAGQFGPDTVVTGRGCEFRIEHRTSWGARTPHELHPDLAVLMSTSGTTGGAKLVRLSREAVVSNAVAIGSSLGLSERDRAVTSLPLHYCFGLSVVTSHLVAGGSVVATSASVVDPCFWGAVERWRVTTLAGVPHTFDMLDRVGTDALRSPSLRLITQAGGRMAPAAVRRYAELGREAGWGFVVMYGQTEATARMAISSAADTLANSSSVGRAIHGGTIRIQQSTDQPERETDRMRGVGEVLYSGPNVMMGYADVPDDLARGQDVTELHTGDLGRLDDAGRLELTGRASRFLKLHGKRVDLDHLERRLSTSERPITCAGDDDGLVVAAVSPNCDLAPDHALRREVLELVSVPEARVAAVRLPLVPRTASGKVDGPALTESARSVMPVAQERSSDRSVADAFVLVLGLNEVDPESSFAELGGDSFSYVEMSIRLERLLGELPPAWHLRPIAELERLSIAAPSRRRWMMQLDTGVVIRAVAILLIVCTHMRLFRLPGGAHALLALVGFNIARFQLLPDDTPGRLRRSASTIARVAVPTSVWIGVNMLIFGGYSVGAVLLLNNYTGDAVRRGGRWEYWYFETFVQVMCVVAVLFAIPAVRRGERRAPFGFALGVLGLTLIPRFGLVQLGGEYNEMFRTHTVACFVALGWCAQRADTAIKRVAVSVAVVLTTVGYFGQTDRELRIIAMILALTWLPTVLVPRPLGRLITPIAAASMWIFLVHWQVWPLLTPWMHNGVAFWLTIATGIGVWWAVGRLGAAWSRSAFGRVGGQRRTVGRSTRNQVSDADTAIRSSDATPVSA
jgi:hypothetical protein